jgi:predicted acylesterase/phospholipase RssA
MSSRPAKTFQILSLSGGGYRGLHIAQVLEIIEENIGHPIARHFDLIAGTSIGGIIGLALALEVPAIEIRKTLEDLGPKLFPTLPPDFSTAQGVFSKSGFASVAFESACNVGKLKAEAQATRSAWYDPEPLRKALSAPEYFGTRLIKDLLHPVIIPAVNYSNGMPKFFKTDHHATFTFDKELPIIDVALGTSAAPIYFPVHKIHDNRIVDGGLIANDPTHVAVHEAMAFFGVRPALFGDESTGSDNLHVLSIGTLSPKRFADLSKPLNQGLLDWGSSVFDLAGSAQESMSAFMVDKHMLPGKVIRLPSLDARPETAPGLADASEKSTEMLKGTARTVAQAAFGRADFHHLFTHTGRTLSEVRTLNSKATQ